MHEHEMYILHTYLSSSDEEDKAKLMPANEDIQQENQGNFILDVQVQVEIKEGRISIFHMGLPNN